MKSQLINYINICKIKTSFKNYHHREGHCHFIHHSGSKETISPIDLYFAMDFLVEKGEVNFHKKMTWGMIHEKKNPMSN